MKMRDLLQKLLEKTRQDKKTVFLLALGLLFLFALGASELFSAKGADVGSDADRHVSVSAYETELENRLEQFLKTVNGVGDVKVCVTLACVETYDYAMNKDLQEGENSHENTEEYVIIRNENGGETGLCIQVKAAEIRGVAVICSGGGSDKVKREVTSLLTAALGITANHVYVSEASES